MDLPASRANPCAGPFAPNSKRSPFVTLLELSLRTLRVRNENLTCRRKDLRSIPPSKVRFGVGGTEVPKNVARSLLALTAG